MDQDIFDSNLSDAEKSSWWQYRLADREKVKALRRNRPTAQLLWHMKFRAIKGELEARAATAAWLRFNIAPR